MVMNSEEIRTCREVGRHVLYCTIIVLVFRRYSSQRQWKFTSGRSLAVS